MKCTTTYKKNRYPNTPTIIVNATVFSISFLCRIAAFMVQIPFVRLKYNTSDTLIAINPAKRKYHLYVPYNVVASDDAKPTEPMPNITRINGETQHNDAIKTGTAEI